MKRKAVVIAIAVALPVAAFADANQGEKIFLQKCKACHVVKGKGGGKVGPDLSRVSATRDDQYLRTKLKTPDKTNPDTVMPSFEDLPDKDFDAVMEYLKTLK